MKDDTNKKNMKKKTPQKAKVRRINRFELLKKRFAVVDDFCKKVESGEVTVSEALLAMSYIGGSNFK